jgi:hypothetical protein
MRGEPLRRQDFIPGFLSTEVLTTNPAKLMGEIIPVVVQGQHLNVNWFVKGTLLSF